MPKGVLNDNKSKQIIQYFHISPVPLRFRCSWSRRWGRLRNRPSSLVRTRHRARACKCVPGWRICAASNSRIGRGGISSIVPPTSGIKCLGALAANSSERRSGHRNGRAGWGVRRIGTVRVRDCCRWPGTVLGELIRRNGACTSAARLPRLERCLEWVAWDTLFSAGSDRIARVSWDPPFLESELIRPKWSLDFASRA